MNLKHLFEVATNEINAIWSMMLPKHNIGTVNAIQKTFV